MTTSSPRRIVEVCHYYSFSQFLSYMFSSQNPINILCVGLVLRLNCFRKKINSLLSVGISFSELLIGLNWNNESCYFVYFLCYYSHDGQIYVWRSFDNPSTGHHPINSKRRGEYVSESDSSFNFTMSYRYEQYGKRFFNAVEIPKIPKEVICRSRENFLSDRH